MGLSWLVCQMNHIARLVNPVMPSDKAHTWNRLAALSRAFISKTIFLLYSCEEAESDNDTDNDGSPLCKTSELNVVFGFLQGA